MKVHCNNLHFPNISSVHVLISLYKKKKIPWLTNPKSSRMTDRNLKTDFFSNSRVFLPSAYMTKEQSRNTNCLRLIKSLRPNSKSWKDIPLYHLSRWRHVYELKIYLTIGIYGLMKVKARAIWQANVSTMPMMHQNTFLPILSIRKPNSGEATAEMMYTKLFTALADDGLRPNFISKKTLVKRKKLERVKHILKLKLNKKL